jgi:hypothetical protein
MTAVALKKSKNGIQKFNGLSKLSAQRPSLMSAENRPKAGNW